jgi:hypothetical protein
MSARINGILHSCLVIFVLSSCAAAPVIPTAGPPRPTLTARPSALPYEPTAAVAAMAEYELLAAGGLASRSAPPGVDLDVTFISREPLYYAYCVEYPESIPHICPGHEQDQHWPEQGELVTFTAHVVNKGTTASPEFDFAWAIDGATVLAGTLPGLASGAEITTSYEWAWGQAMDGEQVLDDHDVGFTIDAENEISESYESNNSLEDRTNALSFSLYITPEMYAGYNLPVDPIYPYSAEDWLQKQIAAINTNLAAAVYPATPDGATVRVRINTIGITATNPDYDFHHDGGWFVNDDYRHGASAYYDPETDIDWGLVHELAHQMGLIDLYTSNIYQTNVFVLNQAGGQTNFGFEWPRGGIMGGGDIYPYTDWNMYDSHTAGGLSSNYGYRNGYYGVYQYDIPLQNNFLVLDNQGNPAPGVEVALYQRTPGLWDWTGHTGLDNLPEISGATDSAGLFPLPNRSAEGGVITRIGHVLHDNPFGVVDFIGGNNRFLVLLSKGTHEEYFWLDITAFNLAYWLGDTDEHTFVISSHIPQTGAPVAPLLEPVKVEGYQVELCWLPGPSVDTDLFRVYRANPPDYLYTQIAELPVTQRCFGEELPGGWYGGFIYSVTALASTGVESGFSNSAWAPRLINPTAVTIQPDGRSLILDAQNGFAILEQDAAGHYLGNLGSVHYHLEQSQYMALDANQHLLLNHPGDWYVPRQSVRIADLELTPLLEFGEAGSNPGQLNNPAGVASWGPACTIDTPYSDDPETLLLLHFDGSFDGAQGETGTPSGVEFAAGRFDQGIHVEYGDRLSYPTLGNLDMAEGTVEFWLKPDWDGDDEQSYTFFEMGYEWFNRMRIMKDGANNLRIMVWDDDTEYGVAYNVGYWKAGEWHHIAATWQGDSIALYADSVQVGTSEGVSMPSAMVDKLYVGSAALDPQYAQGVIDEFRISSVARLGNSQQCNRILVADSGNHRLQAFDSLGGFLSEFGEPGSGVGQFNNPQGVAVDSSGRVLVADSGNNRIVVLGFDGASFTYLDAYTAELNGPTGLAVDAADNIYVADTGNDRIVVLSADGALLGEYTAPNDGSAGNFYLPKGVAVREDGLIIVADTGNARVVRIYPDGALQVVLLPLVER